MAKTQDLPSDALSAFEKYQQLNSRQVMKLVGLTGRTALWEYVKQGKLPRPRYLTPRKPVWQLGEVLDHTHALFKDYDEAPRGFSGDETVQAARAERASSSKADRWKRRFGFGAENTKTKET